MTQILWRVHHTDLILHYVLTTDLPHPPYIAEQDRHLVRHLPYTASPSTG